MNVEELVTFTKLCELKNFTKTAEALTMSQPTVSLHLKNLEQEFQSQLIQRSSKQVSVTPTGELLLERAKQIQQLIAQTKSDILACHDAVQGELKIGASFTIGEYILPMILGDICMEYPQLNLDVTIGNTEEIVKQVKHLQVDIGLIEGTTNEKELLLMPFMEDELVIIVSPTHALAHKKDVQMSDLQNEVWLSRELGSGTRENLQHFLRTHAIKTRAIVTISSNQGVKEAVMNNVGISLISRYTVMRDVKFGDVVIVPVAERFTRVLSYVYSPVMKNIRSVSSFIELVEEKL
ncbi:MAG TPA: LysR family transcriptional regulator [Metalysinibacillus jejuensis]|uniref:LysR family transcriptional regulator n=1 Tax=Metalysinibacillus jejuensis TaxID=914327 RepID=A0A921NA65_9BACL|nr:LysR family transcriptional regulator [Metalysinibacillus jejuensis]HJH10396.1 LysR family transcriptional regulator [Metalysinibacillus jejuensis]